MSYKIFVGDCLEQLKNLSDNSVHCCVTSPPYWALRVYATGEWRGGQADCQHVRGSNPQARESIYASNSEIPAYGANRQRVSPVCLLCGAEYIDRQIGSESVPDCFGWATGHRCGSCYVCRLTAVFEEVRRVLHPSGTLWLNLGDTYIGGKGMSGAPSAEEQAERAEAGETLTGAESALGGPGIMRPSDNRELAAAGWKSKDLVGIPWLMAQSLRAAGWYLRAEIIWHKTNCKPESMRDRTTRQHETIFLLAKRPDYFYDWWAIREPSVSPEKSAKRMASPIFTGKKEQMTGYVNATHNTPGIKAFDGKRNARSVWLMTPAQFKGAHYAVFPLELPTRAIRAGTSEKGVCADCGEPWVRRIEYTDAPADFVADERDEEIFGPGAHRTKHAPPRLPQDAGFEPGCTCGAAVVPPTVLDPFAGSGTTLEAALRLGCNAIGTELSPQYAELIEQRLAAVPVMLFR